MNEGLKANRTENIKFLFLLTLSLRRIYRLFAFGRELPYFVRIYRKLAWRLFLFKILVDKQLGHETSYGMSTILN